MLNTVMTIDCDQCGYRFNRLVLASQPEQQADAVLLLTILVQEDGWLSFRNHHRCPDCCLENLAANQPAR
jgi:hypothetical protein